MRELGETAALNISRSAILPPSFDSIEFSLAANMRMTSPRGTAIGMKPHQIAAAADAETLLAVLDCWLEPNDVLLVKGSRATRMERVIEWLKLEPNSEPYGGNGNAFVREAAVNVSKDEIVPSRATGLREPVACPGRRRTPTYSVAKLSPG